MLVFVEKISQIKWVECTEAVVALVCLVVGRLVPVSCFSWSWVLSSSSDRGGMVWFGLVLSGVLVMVSYSFYLACLRSGVEACCLFMWR